MLDDIDKVNFKNEWIKNEFFSIIDSAITEQKILFVTTNITEFEDVSHIFGEAIASRFLQFKFVNFKAGEDYREITALRKREKQKEADDA